MNIMEYFNLEVSPCKATLAFNASKEGIDSFLKIYGHLPTPPKSISFKQWHRPQRTWHSWCLRHNYHALATDPSPHRVFCASDINSLHDELRIQFLQTDQTNVIFAAGCNPQDGVPILTVNRKGWETFLNMLRCLRDKRYWFYVTEPNNESWLHLPFLLTSPYPGDPDDHVFKIVEFIRLEPEERVFLDLDEIKQHDENGCISFYMDMRSNSVGSLLFSQWMREFASSQDVSRNILNHWNDIFNSVRYGEPRWGEDIAPAWLYLMKTCTDSPYPIFSFGTRGDGTNDIYILGNAKGFEELADFVEEAAFTVDYDYSGSRPPNQRIRGYISLGVLFPDGVHPIKGWGLYYGGNHSPAYQSLSVDRADYKAVEEAERAFMNERIFYGDTGSRQDNG
ncbi:MAG: hypothetical protein HW387_734 [Parachlamydiales bacterium]|nr:hypothetical protein [Parachlamydiales bacterium]